jgi:hypothetical protein
MPASGGTAKRKWMIRTRYEIVDRQSETDNCHNQKECSHGILSNQGVSWVSLDARHTLYVGLIPHARPDDLEVKAGLYWTAHGKVNQPRASGKKKKNETRPTPIE